MCNNNKKRPDKALLTNVNEVTNDNAVVGYYNDKFIIYDFVAGELCYQCGANCESEKLFPIGELMLGELTPITELSKAEQEQINKLYPKEAIDEIITCF